MLTIRAVSLCLTQAATYNYGPHSRARAQCQREAVNGPAACQNCPEGEKERGGIGHQAHEWVLLAALPSDNSELNSGNRISP